MRMFLSYASEDLDVARRLVDSLGGEWSIFWDRSIHIGSEWCEDIVRELRRADAVLVLWSEASRRSLWVQGEAAYAHERGTLVSVKLSEDGPPRLFMSGQNVSIAEWVRDGRDVQLDALRGKLRDRFSALPRHSALPVVDPNDPVEPGHAHLIHSCWRVDKESPYGRMPYQIHCIVYADDSVLRRVESVRYILEGYPEGRERQPGGPLDRLFELKELANGYSVVRAVVRIRDQPPGHPRDVVLTRFINMSESGPRLERDFIQRGLWRSSLSAKLNGLEDAKVAARAALSNASADRAREILVSQGVPPFLADAAVWHASREDG